MAAILTVPICCICKQVSDHEGTAEVWMQLQCYQDRHHLASEDYQLSHTYCPACFQRQAKAWFLPITFRPRTRARRGSLRRRR